MIKKLIGNIMMIVGGMIIIISMCSFDSDDLIRGAAVCFMVSGGLICYTGYQRPVKSMMCILLVGSILIGCIGTVIGIVAWNDYDNCIDWGRREIFIQVIENVEG